MCKQTPSHNFVVAPETLMDGSKGLHGQGLMVDDQLVILNQSQLENADAKKMNLPPPECKMKHMKL